MLTLTLKLPQQNLSKFWEESRDYPLRFRVGSEVSSTISSYGGADSLIEEKNPIKEKPPA